VSDRKPMAAEDRARLEAVLEVNPFVAGPGFVDWALWEAVRNFCRLLTDSDGMHRDNLLREAQRVTMAEWSKRPSTETLGRELRGRGAGSTRRTVRSELERQGFRVVCDGKVRIEAVS